ncbi:MAG: sugar phosphate isomerase/epimerase [Clostridiales Family XIII bacterium]|nr:sugar phosphate isomerase/epimerase [Clostridiales Family XIII bacterium]
MSTNTLAPAKSNGVTIIFEPEQANVISTAEDALKLIEHFNTPYLKVLYGAANIVTTEHANNPLEIIKSSLELLKDHIALAHCKDAIVTHEKITFAPIGKETLPLKAYIKELQKFYNGPFIMHGLDEADVPDALTYLETER